MVAKRQTSLCSDGTSPDIYDVQNISQNILVGDKRVLVTPLLPVQGQALTVTRKVSRPRVVASGVAYIIVLCYSLPILFKGISLSSQNFKEETVGA